MTPENFAYWMQGFVELNGSAPTPEQWKSIKDHLQLVFKKVTPQVDLGLFHKPMMPPAIGPNQTYIPTPLYEPRITCSIGAVCDSAEDPRHLEKLQNRMSKSAAAMVNSRYGH